MTVTDIRQLANETRRREDQFILGRGMSKAARARDTEQSDREWVQERQRKHGQAVNVTRRTRFERSR